MLHVFEARYCADRLTVLNTMGDVGVVTLWTPVPTALGILERCDIDVDPATSRIAVAANLYGDGLPQMIRNLLWNPQIKHLLIFGQNLSGSAEELVSLLTQGVEPIDHLGQQRYRIVGTVRTLDTCFPPELLIDRYVVRYAPGKPSSIQVAAAIVEFFATLPTESTLSADRVDAPLPVYTPTYFPSNPRSHTIVRDTPLDAWEEVVCRVLRYGIPSQAGRYKRRLELQNLKVVVEYPIDTRDEDLAQYGFSGNEFRTYADSLLDGEIPEGLHYSYGNRIRKNSLNTIDQLAACVRILNADLSDRGAYVTLWDPAVDLESAYSSPCLVTLFFRVFEGKLTLSATFRSHNVMSAWLKNVHGLMRLQRYVAERLTMGVPCGALTIISHSISIDPAAQDRVDLAQRISVTKIDDLQLDRKTGKRELRTDPNGYFTFTIDRDVREVVACLKQDGTTLATYRGKTAEAVEHQIARDAAISDIGHALYVGRQLSLLEQRLRDEK